MSIGPVPFWTDALQVEQEELMGKYPPALSAQTQLAYVGIQPQFVQGASGQQGAGAAGQPLMGPPTRPPTPAPQIGGGPGGFPQAPLGPPAGPPGGGGPVGGGGGPPRGGGPPGGGGPPRGGGPPGGPKPPGGPQPTGGPQPPAGPPGQQAAHGGRLMGEPLEFFTGSVTNMEKFIHQFSVFQWMN
jgi:hypothetical protein